MFLSKVMIKKINKDDLYFLLNLNIIKIEGVEYINN